GEIAPKSAVTPVTGRPGYKFNSLKLRALQVLQVKNSKLANRPVTAVTGTAKPDVESEELKALAMDSVPEPYLDGWARLQCQKPMRVSGAEWRRALDDAGRFLDQWGSLAVEFDWSPGDLFDVPRDGKHGGPVWFLGGETV